MQNIKYKNTRLFTLILGAFLLLGVQTTKAQKNSELLEQADSLFEAKKYTQSLEHYHRLFTEEGVYTPQMLLKMAYIHEGLGDYSQALFYLNNYYVKTSDETALRKMEALAEKHKLSGYQFTDTDLFLSYYNKYVSEITFAALAFCLLLLAFIFYQRKKNNPVVFPAVGLGVALILLAFMINGTEQVEKGIITNGTAYLMTAPSSGSGVVDIVTNGHRVSILGKEDVWYKIIWDGGQAYIRQNQLLEL